MYGFWNPYNFQHFRIINSRSRYVQQNFWNVRITCTPVQHWHLAVFNCMKVHVKITCFCTNHVPNNFWKSIYKYLQIKCRSYNNQYINCTTIHCCRSCFGNALWKSLGDTAFSGHFCLWSLHFFHTLKHNKKTVYVVVESHKNSLRITFFRRSNWCFNLI